MTLLGAVGVLAACGNQVARGVEPEASTTAIPNCVTSELPIPKDISYVDTRKDASFWGPFTDRVKYYSSIQELQADSSAVVVAHATPSAYVESSVPDEYDNIPFTVRTFTVKETLSGSVPSGELNVRESGVQTQQMTTEAGRDYVLFLTPFEFHKGEQYKGQFTAVGGIAGQFALQNSFVVRIDPETSNIPPVISLPMVRHELGLC